MNRILTRVVAVVVLPSLLLDPVSARSLPGAISSSIQTRILSSPNSPSFNAVFTQNALAAGLVGAFTTFKERAIFLRQGGKTAREVQGPELVFGSALASRYVAIEDGPLATLKRLWLGGFVGSVRESGIISFGILRKSLSVWRQFASNRNWRTLWTELNAVIDQAGSSIRRSHTTLLVGASRRAISAESAPKEFDLIGQRDRFSRLYTEPFRPLVLGFPILILAGMFNAAAQHNVAAIIHSSLAVALIAFLPSLFIWIVHLTRNTTAILSKFTVVQELFPNLALAMADVPARADTAADNRQIEAQARLRKMRNGASSSVLTYDVAKAAYVPHKFDKVTLQRLFTHGDIGLIENPQGKSGLAWVEKREGGFVLPDGNLLISGNLNFPNQNDVPLGRIDLPRYSKVVPEVYHFFKYYLGKEEFIGLADYLAKTKVVVVKPGSIGGGRLFDVDSSAQTIRIDQEFLDLLIGQAGPGKPKAFAMGQKRVLVGLFAEALTELYEKEPASAENRQRINRIAQISQVTNALRQRDSSLPQPPVAGLPANRLDDAVGLFRLRQIVRDEHRALTDAEKEWFLADRMERTYSYNGRRAAEALRNEFAGYGLVKAAEAEVLLRKITTAHPDIVFVQPYKADETKPDDAAADPFKDRTDSFSFRVSYLADWQLVDKRYVIWDYEVTARDAAIAGSKVTNTGEMQNIAGAVTLPMFATSAQAFGEGLIKVNSGLDERFVGYDAAIRRQLNDLVMEIRQRIASESNRSVKDVTDAEAKTDESYTLRSIAILQEYERLFKGSLHWGEVEFSPQLRREIYAGLRHMADRLGISVRTLILAIRSSALGEDSERASFAGRQDSLLFRSILNFLAFIIERRGNLELGRKVVEQIQQFKDQWETWMRELDHKDTEPDRKKALRLEMQEGSVAFLREIGQSLREVGVDVKFNEANLGISVEPWIYLAHQLTKEADRIAATLPPATDDDLEPFLKDWLEVQASLFNFRAMDYRVRQNPPLPFYAEDVRMSSPFQQMAFFDKGLVGFGINRQTGMEEFGIGITAGSTNAIVANKTTTDTVHVRPKGEVREHRVPPERGVWELPFPAGRSIDVPVPASLRGQPVTTDWSLLGLMGVVANKMYGYMGIYTDYEGGLVIRRDEAGQPLLVFDPNEPDGIAKDRSGNPRQEHALVYTQLRPETRFNFENRDIIVLHYLDMPESDFEALCDKGFLLIGEKAASKPAYGSRGAAAGEIFWVDKERPEEWGKAHGKVIAAVEGTPDMDAAFHAALAGITQIGGPQSHTAIMSTEFGWVVVTGIPESAMRKLYNGRRVTVLASKEAVLSGDHSDKLRPMGQDANMRDLGIMPGGFSLGLNVNAAATSHAAGAVSSWISNYGSGLIRLELYLRLVGEAPAGGDVPDDMQGLFGAPEGLLRFDNTLYQQYFKEAAEGHLTAAGRNWLNQALAVHGDLSRLRPHVLQSGEVQITDNKKKQTFNAQQFYDQYVKDDVHPPYNPADAADAKLIKFFNAIVKATGFVSGEQRYLETLSRGIEGVAEPLIAKAVELQVLAGHISDPAVRARALAVADQYAQARQQLAPEWGVSLLDRLLKRQPERVSENPDEYISQLNEIIQVANAPGDLLRLRLMLKLLKPAFYIRLDDRKSDELAKMPGSRVEVDRNPMAGYRGIRMMLDDPRILKMQLRALMKLHEKDRYRLRIFAPVVFEPKQFAAMQSAMREVGFSDKVIAGIMTETPQAFEVRPFLEAGIGFTSTGGNDQLQFGVAVDRQTEAKPLLTLTNRQPALMRMLATVANETRRWNAGLAKGVKKVTSGFCGDWPSKDPLGAIVLFIYGYDSASLTVPGLKPAAESLFGLLDHLYSHAVFNGYKILHYPQTPSGEVDRNKIALDILALIAAPDRQKGLPDNLIKILPALKRPLEERNFNIYDEINPEAKAEIHRSYFSGKVSELHVALPFHYRLLEDYDAGHLAVQDAPQLLASKLGLAKETKERELTAFQELQRRSRAGEEISVEQFDRALELVNKAENQIESLEKDLESIELQGQVRSYLESTHHEAARAGQPGKEFYVQTLVDRFKSQALDAIRKGETFWVETACEPADLVKYKPGGKRYEASKEANPELGNRGMKKNLHQDRTVFQWSLEAVRALRHDPDIVTAMEHSHGNIGVVFRMVREPLEIADAKKVLEHVFVRGEADSVPIGLAVDVPATQWVYDDYLKGHPYGIRALIMSGDSQRLLAQFKRGTEWDNKNAQRLGLPPLITDADVQTTLEGVTLPITMTASQIYGIPVYLPLDAPAQPAETMDPSRKFSLSTAPRRPVAATTRNFLEVARSALNRVTQLPAFLAVFATRQISSIVSRLLQFLHSHLELPSFLEPVFEAA